MPNYIAMLRGVNVGGVVLKMEQLRESLTKMGLKEVRTYVQSGNVVFGSPKAAPSTLAQKISARIARDFDLTVPVIVRAPADLAKVLEINPFLKVKGVDLKRLYVTFLQSTPSKSAQEGLKRIISGKGDEFRLLGQEIYLHCPGGYGETKLNNNAFEKALEIKATTRNWNTINALVEMAQD